jgi:uracil-DNA glycosylase family 4
LNFQQQLDGLQPYQIMSCKGYGQTPADFMFMGISAGKLGALKTEVPLTKDNSGRIFQRMLGQLGLSKSDESSIKPVLVNCYITNFVKGRILDKEGNNRLPTNAEFAYWKDQVQDEVDSVKPKIIIALGELVFTQLKYYDIGYHGCEIKKARHPRWYASHGALSVAFPKGKQAFEQMVKDYKALLE